MPHPTVSYDFKGPSRPPKPRRLVQTQGSDGDTLYIEQPVRMVSCDTPEKAGYAGGPMVAQPKLDTCRQRLEGGFYAELPEPLIAYLVERLTPDAAHRHIAAANLATQAFQKMRTDRLTLPDGKVRQTAVIPAGEFIDPFGRLLAYLSPYYRNNASDPLPPPGDPRRNTFNLDMIAEGWAAFFPIYPSLPRKDDMNRAIAAAGDAWDEPKGVWREFGRNLLLGYEYRACIKLGEAATAPTGITDAFQRTCIDLRSMHDVGRFGFADVPPPYRLWVWLNDVDRARKDLGFTS